MPDEKLKNDPPLRASNGPTDKAHIPRPISSPLVTVDMAMMVWQVIKHYARYSPDRTFTPIKETIEEVGKDGITEDQVMNNLEILKEQQRIKRKHKDNIYVK